MPLSDRKSEDEPGEDKRIDLFQGSHIVTRDPHVVVHTILGSCVAACIRDPVAGLGGVNHFLLPGDPSGDVERRAGETPHLMDVLLDELLREGARRERLEAKLFGGAHPIGVLADIGAQNADYAIRFLTAHGIRLQPGSLGGRHGRRLQVWPATGRIRQCMIHTRETDTCELP
jgi:chemotaxis protein CheD